MPTFTPTEIDLVSNDPQAWGLDDLRIKCDKIISYFKQENGWIDEDIRLNIFHKLRNSTQDILAMYVFSRGIFPTKSFWEAYFINTPTETDFENHIRELDTMIRFAALHSYFSIYESIIRALVNKIDPTACGGGTANFGSIMGWMLARTITIPEIDKFVELIRLIRNTIHHNGEFRPERGGDVAVVYEGKTYDFKVGVVISFVDWSFVTKTENTIIDFFQALVDNPLIKQLPA